MRCGFLKAFRLETASEDARASQEKNFRRYRRGGERIKADARKLLDDYNAKLRNIDVEARTKIQEAVLDGSRIAAEMREQAREEARQILERSREELARDVAKAQSAIAGCGCRHGGQGIGENHLYATKRGRATSFAG